MILDHNIIIQKDISDGTGEPVWQTFARMCASKKGLKGLTYYQAAVNNSESNVIYTVRYRKGITAGMQIIEGASVLRIKGPPVDVQGNNQWLEIHAEEVLINGG